MNTITTITSPMTAIFTPPTTCSNHWTYEPQKANDVAGGLLIQDAKYKEPDAECRPTGYLGWGRAPSIIQIFSPGACPSGYTAAQQNPGPTTTEVCCPSNFGYTSFVSGVNAGHTTAAYYGCTSYFTNPYGTTTVFAEANTSTAVFSSVLDGTASIFTALTGSVTMWAQPITVAFQQQDLALFVAVATSASPTSPASATSATSTSSTTTSTSSTTISSSSMTTSSTLSTSPSSTTSVTPTAPLTTGAAPAITSAFMTSTIAAAFTTPAAATPNPVSAPSISAGSIAGIAIGAAALIGLLIGGAVFVGRRRRYPPSIGSGVPLTQALFPTPSLSSASEASKGYSVPSNELYRGESASKEAGYAQQGHSELSDHSDRRYELS